MAVGHFQSSSKVRGTRQGREWERHGTKILLILLSRSYLQLFVCTYLWVWATVSMCLCACVRVWMCVHVSACLCGCGCVPRNRLENVCRRKWRMLEYVRCCLDVLSTFSCLLKHGLCGWTSKSLVCGYVKDQILIITWGWKWVGQSNSFKEIWTWRFSLIVCEELLRQRSLETSSKSTHLDLLWTKKDGQSISRKTFQSADFSTSSFLLAEARARNELLTNSITSFSNFGQKSACWNWRN